MLERLLVEVDVFSVFPYYWLEKRRKKKKKKKQYPLISSAMILI